MDPDPEPFQQSFILVDSILAHGTSESLIYGLLGLLLIAIFIVFSGLFSSSENAFFSLNPNDLVLLNDENSPSSQVALELINEPERKIATRRLLATILLMNNLVNIFIVIFSSSLFEFIFDVNVLGPLLTFLIQVVLITFILVLLGEVIPKIYATQNNLRIIRLMARPLKWCYVIFKPIILLLSGSSTLFDRYIKKRVHNISMEEISQAIDIADEDKEIEEKHILKGLISFGNTSVKQIMKPRTEVACIEIQTRSAELMKLVSEWSYSRIPVYEDSFDNVKGILYIKDLLPHLHEKEEFNWQQLLRPPLFVPELKKIDDLLEEFQEKRIHMAVVVDEYGGTSGIVTMEDILEEVFGEIRDEFDEDELVYSQLDDTTYVFEGKTSLNDIAKILEIDVSNFDDIRGDSDTLGGLILEINGGFPEKGVEVNHNGFSFIVESVDDRRIKRVKLEFTGEDESDEDE
ncbi:gliding motility-associated protein GldE [bacterium]|nr:gliding motility-associated protein GldE [bacterium]